MSSVSKSASSRSSFNWSRSNVKCAICNSICRNLFTFSFSCCSRLRWILSLSWIFWGLMRWLRFVSSSLWYTEVSCCVVQIPSPVIVKSTTARFEEFVFIISTISFCSTASSAFWSVCSASLKRFNTETFWFCIIDFNSSIPRPFDSLSFNRFNMALVQSCWSCESFSNNRRSIPSSFCSKSWFTDSGWLSIVMVVILA